MGFASLNPSYALLASMSVIGGTADIEVKHIYFRF